MSYSKTTVDQGIAEKLLKKAIERVQDEFSQLPVTQWDTDIRAIIQGKHLTFRYILVTALLGKATNSNINPLALQAGANIEGAYDARSLCHSVVVPLERQLLSSSLGGSNEPFLNKPARFPTISPSNPVRAGKDKKLLLTLHKILSEIETSEQAFSSLCVAIKWTIERQASRSKTLSLTSNSTDSHLKIIEFIKAFVTKSIEGQVAAITVGTILSLHYDQFEGFEVIVHPVNQSGASSNEVADIDIKKNGRIFIALEVKDKQFSEQDVDHAAFKASQYGLNSITFIIGRNGSCTSPSLEQIANRVLSTRNISPVFTELISFVSSIIALSPELTFAQFLERLKNYANNARVKDDVFEHMEYIFQSILD